MSLLRFGTSMGDDTAQIDWKTGNINGRPPMASVVDQINATWGKRSFSASEIYGVVKAQLEVAVNIRDNDNSPLNSFRIFTDGFIESMKIQNKKIVAELLTILSGLKNLIDMGPPIYFDTGVPAMESSTFAVGSYWHTRILKSLRMNADFVSLFIKKEIQERGGLTNMPLTFVQWMVDMMKGAVAAVTGVPGWIWGLGIAGFVGLYAWRMLPRKE